MQQTIFSITLAFTLAASFHLCLLIEVYLVLSPKSVGSNLDLIPFDLFRNLAWIFDCFIPIGMQICKSQLSLIS